MSSPSCAIGLDIGSNSFSCAKITTSKDGRTLVTMDTSRPVRLSANLEPGGILDKAAIYRGLDALEDLFVEFEMNKYPMRAVGTAALRITSAPQDFVTQAKKIIGVNIEILSGHDEALLASKGAVLGLNESDSWIVVDVGGQSTEICWKSKNTNWSPASIPMGVLSLTKRFLFSQAKSSNQFDALERYVSKKISEVIPKNLNGQLVGVAGTATTLGLLELGLTSWQREKVHGAVVSLKNLNNWIELVQKLPVKDRISQLGISARRAEIFPAGLCVIRAVISHLGKEQIIVSANGLRVGAALSLLQKE